MAMNQTNFGLIYSLFHTKITQKLHSLTPIWMSWEIFRQKVYVKFVLEETISQFTANSEGGYGSAHRISTLLLHSKHLIADPRGKKTRFGYCRIFEFLLVLVVNS